MPPKKAPTRADATGAVSYSLSQNNLAMLRAVLCCVDDFKPDFNKVTAVFGLSKGHG
jgi:hypothetical protein